MNVPIQILFVEDDIEDRQSIGEQLRQLFTDLDIAATVIECGDFDTAKAFSRDPSRHFDLIVSDTYKGPTGNRDAEVLELIAEYKKDKFTPLIVISSGVKPPELSEGPFLMWAGKVRVGEIEEAVKTMMATGIPQLSRKLHTQLNYGAGNFLWTFLEGNWLHFKDPAASVIVERLIRRRAAILLADLVQGEQGSIPLDAIAGLEYYVYPPLHSSRLQLGSILRHRESGLIRVVLTPHCHLAVQPNQTKPRAEKVLTVRVVSAKDVIGVEKLEKVRGLPEPSKRARKLLSWATPPSKDIGQPEGRYWFLPEFLQIPHSYCDFMDIETVPFEKLSSDYEHLATLSPPFAESLQSHFVGYYGSVGIMSLNPDSIATLLK